MSKDKTLSAAKSASNAVASYAYGYDYLHRHVSRNGDTFAYNSRGEVTNATIAANASAYTPDGKLAKRTWERGITSDYSYDNWGNLTNTVYSDNTPTISLSYDALGRQIEARDAAGVTTFLYDSFGSLTNETVVGVAGTNTITRYWDEFGRTAGYTLNNVRQSTLAYDPATARLATMLANGSANVFVWTYLPGSDLKSSLVYPNGLTASWQYDANNQLLQVCNATPTNIISQYDYVYDVAGRRITCAKSGSAFAQNDTLSYGYNEKSELTNAVASVDSDYRYAYGFDDIGNRKTSSERGTNSVYAANQLNQYSVVDDFVPKFDDDGNQIMVNSDNSILCIEYDGENCVNRWIQDGRVEVVLRDRFCRIVAKVGRWRVYDNFLMVADGNEVYIWDPTEGNASRPLLRVSPRGVQYCLHDGNKNIVQVMSGNCQLCEHRDYSPFGKIVNLIDRTGIFGYEKVPFGFSSEYYDAELGLNHYNFRYLNTRTGRWIQRDLGEETLGCNLYQYINNNPIFGFDYLGLERCFEANSTFSANFEFKGWGAIGSFSFTYSKSVWQKTCYDIQCKDCSRGYSIERVTKDSFGGGASWNLPIPNPASPLKIPIGYSYSLSGGEHYFYNSCTGFEVFESCHSLTLSGSVGASIGLGRFISYRVALTFSYEWTDCGGEKTEIAINGTLEQCYVGMCWSIDFPLKQWGF